MHSSKVRGAALAMAVLLAGCGQGSSESTGGETAAAAAGGMPANWKATDACSILSKAAVAEILKVPVPETRLGLVSEPGSANAGTSECTYLGADGAAVATMMARWSPINDNTPEAIAGAKSAMTETLKAFSKGPPEDVPGLGKAAFVADSLGQMSVYLDDARMIMITPSKLPDGLSAKDAAVALAKRAGV